MFAGSGLHRNHRCGDGKPIDGHRENLAAAMSSSTRRASAATRRIGQPSVWMASDPPEPPWSTVVSVLPMTQVVSLVRYVELVGHHLAEGRAGALAAIRFSRTRTTRVLLAWMTSLASSSCRKSGVLGRPAGLCERWKRTQPRRARAHDQRAGGSMSRAVSRHDSCCA